MKKSIARREAGHSVKPMPLRQQHKLMTKERIMEAGVRVFLERGYADATIDDIVAAASIGRATFYLHFKSKLEVMRALIRVVEQQNEVLIEELRDIARPNREALEAWIRQFVEHWLVEADRFLVGLQALASEPELSDELQGGIRMAIEIVTRLIRKERKLSPVEATLRAELLVYSLQQACRSLMSESSRYDVDLVVRVITEIWIANLGL